MKLDSQYIPVYRHQEFQFPLLDAAHCGTESKHQVSNGSLIGLFSLILSHFTRILNLVPHNNTIRVKERYGCHLRLGAHFQSQDALRTTKETKTLDACIGLPPSWDGGTCASIATRSSRPKVISPDIMSPETRAMSPENNHHVARNSVLQWNPAITKCHGTEKNVCYSGVFVIAKTPL